MNEEVKKKKRLNRKSKKLIIVLFFSMAFFVVITYAWFIGLSVAKVNTFEIKISANEGLSLSLDGLNFYDEINLGNTENEILNNVLNAYPGNPNSWLGVNQTKWNAPGSDETTLEAKKTTDLLPVSTNGLIDQNGSVLTLFTKSSMTSSNGGYALTSDRYLNKLDASGTYLPDEQKGYIVFNLFIKNNDNTKYIKNYNMFNDEAIYMSTDSSVKLVQSSEYDGESSGGDGLENSLRIAFMQIGRVDADSSQEDVTSITCTTTDKVTGLCNAYSKVTDTEQPDGTYYQKDTDVDKSNFNTFAIWEPNELKHTTDSKDHFRRICKNRNSNGTYSDTICTFNENGYMDTYVVRNGITASHNVDIYDGLNNYYENTSTNATTLLQKMKYYTDSMIKDGDYRDQVFMLAPNSITLVKVYIYLEGQDVDNYDLESVGKAFAINFGFTKDKYEDTEGTNTHIAGDLNGDGIVNTDDTEVMRTYIATSPTDFDTLDVADVNHDGSVDILDLMRIKTYLVGSSSELPLETYHETFPDVNFRKCLFENYVEDESLNCPNMNIKSVQGIETLNLSSDASVNLSHNRIEKIDDNIRALYLYLNNNNISSITSEINADYIDLSYNNLSSLGFTPATGGYLNLSHNNFKTFANNYALDTLNLSYNELESFSNSRNIVILNLSHNKLTWSDVQNIFPVSVLDLSYNNLTQYTDRLCTIDLNLEGNQITALETDYVNGLSGVVNISHNNISALLGVDLNVENIDLSYNKIGYVNAHGCRMNFSHNNLTGAYIVSTCVALNRFDLTYNKIQSIQILSADDEMTIDIRNNSYNGCVNVTGSYPESLTILREDQMYCH